MPVCVRKETVTKLFFHNSFRFNKIFRSLSLAILGGFFLAACNQEGSSTGANQEAAASAPTYSAQSIAQARRDTQTEKAADRDLQRYQADLRLKEVQINAERESKNQFDGDAAKLEVEKVRQNGENYRADSSAAAQKTAALTSTLGTVVSAVGPAMINSSGEAKKAKLQIDDNKLARAERREDKAADNALEYYKIDKQYGGGDGMPRLDKLKAELADRMADKENMLALQKAKAEIDSRAKELRLPGTKDERKSKISEELGKLTDSHPELVGYRDAVLAQDDAAKASFSKAFDSEIRSGINEATKDISGLSSQLPPQDRPRRVKDGGNREITKKLMDRVNARAGLPVAEQPGQAPSAADKGKNGESNFLCDKGDTDCGGLKDEIDKMSDDFFDLAKVDLVEGGSDARAKFSAFEKKFQDFEQKIQTAIDGNSKNELFKTKAEGTLEAFRGALNKLKSDNAAAREALKDAKSPADIYKIAQKQRWIERNGSGAVRDVEIDANSVIKGASDISSPRSMHAGVGNDFSPNAGSRETDGSTIDLFNNPDSVPRATPIFESNSSET